MTGNYWPYGEPTLVQPWRAYLAMFPLPGLQRPQEMTLY